MREALLRWTGTEFSARKGVVVLLLILLAVGLQSVLSAIAQPFWYDEILTVILCRLSGAHEIWNALQHGADTHPPLFFVIARLIRKIVCDDHLGYRLPSIFGVLVAVCSIYFTLSRRGKRVSALAGASFVLCTDLTPFAYEARPYALMVGCIASAILFWQRIDDSSLYFPALSASLAMAVSLHYYAIFVWPALIVAELFVWIPQRRFRAKVWASLVIGAIPLMLFAGLLLKLRRSYGQNYWASPNIKQIYLSYNNLLKVDSHWGFVFAIGITAVIIFAHIMESSNNIKRYGDNKGKDLVPIEEQVLALMLLWLPVIAVAAAKIAGGGLTWRHMLPAVLGCSLAVGILVDKAPSAVRLLLLLLLLLNYEAYMVPSVWRAVTWKLLEQRENAAHEVASIVNQIGAPDMPIVIGGELDYLPIVYYTPAFLEKRLNVIVDPRSAITYLNTASGDLGLLAIQPYYPLHVNEFGSFVNSHREFILISGTDLDWITKRLVHDGNTLKLISPGDGERTSVYKVTIGVKNDAK